MLVRNNQKLHDVDLRDKIIDIVIINDTSISCVNFEKILGVTLANLISWDKHIDNLLSHESEN